MCSIATSPDDTRTVEIFITRLCKKIDAGFAQPLIQTLRYVGYTIRSPAGKPGVLTE